MATQIGDLPLVQKLIDRQFEEIPTLQQCQQQQQQQQQFKQQQKRSPDSTKTTTTSPRRRISRQVVMSSLGLIPVIDQKNERGMSSLHIAAAAGNM